MIKHIGTLVKDIYGVLESGRIKLDTQKLAEMISSRLSGHQSGPALRMSTLGEKCLRKLWYRHNKPEAAEPIPGRTLLNFLIGDIVEEVVLSLAEQSGHKVEGRQESLTLENVLGHRDAIIDGVMVDVKSANSRSMEKFKNHTLEKDDPFGYIEQINAYAEASKDDDRVKVKGEVAFLAVDKELGHLVVDKYKRKEIDWQKKITNVRSVLSHEHPPSRPYVAEPDGKSGNLQLPLPCRYCQYKNTCWPGLRTFIYSSGPKYLTHVERLPNVEEVTPNKEIIEESNNRQSLEEQDEKVT